MSRRVIHALTLVILFCVVASESAAEQPCPVAREADLSTLLDAIGALPMGGWVRANQNSFSDVWTPEDLRPLDELSNPPPSKIIEAWSGFAWDCRRSDLLLFGGGHANYSGNDTYRWRARSGLWERMSLPSEVVKIGGSNSIEFAAVDGPYAAPIAAHTYDTNIYLPFADRFLVFGGAAYGTGGGFHVQQADGTFRTTGPYFFNPAKADAGRVGGTTGSHVQRVAPHPEILGGNMWDNRDIYQFPAADFPSSFVFGTTAYKSSQGRDVVLVTGASGGSTSFELYSYVVSDADDALSDAVQKIGQYWDGFDDPAAGAYDPDLNAYVLLARVGSSATFVYWDLNTAGPSNKNVNFWPTGLTSSFGNPGHYGMDYDPVRKQFVLWDGGAQVWVLKPPAQLSGNGWTIERASAPTTSAPDQSLETNGVYGKWKYVGELDAFVGLQGVSEGNVWIYKPLGWQRPGNSSSPAVTLSATPSTVIAGQSTTLAWSSNNVTSCTASGGWSGAKATSGSQSSGPLTATTSFTLDCVGPGGSIQQSVTVTVTASTPPPTLTFTAAPIIVASGSSSTLTWSSTDATSCTASGGWSGTKATSGSQSSGALTATTGFTLTCAGAGGSANQSVTVTVVPAPTLTFSATPTSVSSGAAATLAWSTTNATSCTASGGWSGAKATSGSQSSGALTASSSFDLACSGTGGSITRSVTVSVTPTSGGSADIAINAGGPALTGYVADNYYSGGTAYTFGNQTGVYDTERWSTSGFSYAIPTTPGQVQVTLRLRESCVPCKYVRTFAVAAEGQTVISSLTVPSQTVADQTFVVTTDATLNLQFTSISGEAWVNAIEVRSLGGATAPTVTLTANPINVASGGSSALTWSSTNATSCTASGGWSGAKATSGSQSSGALTATTSFTLNCTGPGGSANQNVTVTVVPAPTLTFSATPTTVSSGAAATLAWSTTNATSCTASGGWSGAKATSGSQSSGALTATTSFTLDCSGSGGSIQQSATVTVTASTPPPALTFTAAPINVASGSSSTLTWSSTDATSCTASGGWSGAKATSGSQSSGALTATTSFALTCTGAGGSANQSVTVTVVPAPTLTFSATPTSVSSGAAATLAWSTTNATSCTASGGWNGAKATSGSQSSGPLTTTTSFALDCSGPGGSITRSLTVTVNPPSGGSTGIAINAGGPALTGYVADNYYSGGKAYTFGSVSGVYNTERWSTSGFSYAIPTTPGQVQVTLRLRESCVPCKYVRTFAVAAEGQIVIPSLTVPALTVADQTFVVTTDATLNLQFTSISGEAWVNAIEVQPVGH